jgi:hypothetical protein
LYKIATNPEAGATTQERIIAEMVKAVKKR